MRESLKYYRDSEQRLRESRKNSQSASAEASPPDPRDEEIARLTSKLAEAAHESIHRPELLSGGTDEFFVAGQPAAGVFEPLTPHGLQAMAQSKHKHYTCAQLTAAIKDGTEPWPGNHVLCSDGWWVTPD